MKIIFSQHRSKTECNTSRNAHPPNPNPWLEPPDLGSDFLLKGLNAFDRFKKDWSESYELDSCLEIRVTLRMNSFPNAHAYGGHPENEGAYASGVHADEDAGDVCQGQPGDHAHAGGARHGYADDREISFRGYVRAHGVR